MEKLWIIIKREYLTRVTRKSFIIATLLTPLAFGLLMVVVGVIFAYQSDDVKNIVISDEGNVLKRAIADSKSLYFTFSNESLDELKGRYNQGEFDGILILPSPDPDDIDNKKWVVSFLADKQLEPEAMSRMKSELEKKMRSYRMEQLGIEEKMLSKIDVNVVVDPDQVNKRPGAAPQEKAFTSLTSAVASGIGMVIGILMYLMVFINGSMVMRSVMEEKTSRIVEVMISSVKPFQLMLGKLIGVGAVGITQLLIWGILLPVIALIAAPFIASGADPQAMMEMQGAAMAAPPVDVDSFNPVQLIEELKRMNWPLILTTFILFFLGGFFIYSSLFAAVGSAIGDDMGEGQSLTIPITVPVLLAFYIMIVAVRSPNSTLAVWASIFPLFSPIVMPARIAFDPPVWQIVLSLVLLIASALFFVWLSARIYRVGILMYGKKATFKDLRKWFFYKG
jgi:ABC-2 type transport system permease protein